MRMPVDDRATFGDLVRRARRAANLSQEELAARAGLSARGISDLERGVNRTPRKDTLELLADALNLSIDERRTWEHSRRQFSTSSTRVRTTAQDVAIRTTTNLPARLTSFVGRDEEIARLRDLLGQPGTRLVTITGSGGIGKTSLAMQVATDVSEWYRDGVHFVSLAPIHDSTLVTTAIVSALGLQSRSDQVPQATLVDALSEKHILLVLDNFEQIVEAAPAVADLLRTCPMLQVLVTSRKPLHVSGEWEYLLTPLTVPSLDNPSSVDEIGKAAAVAVFVERARAVKSDFKLTVDNVATVVEICHRLDGLPLAIELAAARVRYLPPAAMLGRLAQRLEFLSVGVRDAPARQRTLRDTIRWSYDLLSADEQRLFRTACVFRGGWTTEALEEISREEVEVNVADGLDRLIEQSLVSVTEQPDGTVRYVMLETIREFGQEQLTAQGELDVMQHRHASYFTSFFQPAPAEWRGPRVSLWLSRSERERDNVRSALDWAVEHDADLALRLCRSYSWYWFARGPHQEARAWFTRALEHSQPAHSSVRAPALCRAASFAISQCDHQAARQLIEEGLALYRELDDVNGIAEAIYNLGRVAMMTAQFDEAVRLFEECASISRDPAFLVPSLSNLGNSRIGTGDYNGAQAALDEGLVLAHQYGDTSEIGFFLCQQGLLALKRGDLAAARRQFAAGIPILRDLGESRLSTHVLEWCAWLAAIEGQPVRTATLLGAASTLRGSLGNPLQPRDELDYDRYVPVAKVCIEPEGWNVAWAIGCMMTLHDALTYALADL